LIFVTVVKFVFQSFDVIDYFYQSRTLSKYVVFSRSMSFFIVNSLIVLLIILKSEVFYFAVVYTVESALSGLLLIVSYKMMGNKLILWRASKRIAIYLLKSSWPLAASFFLTTAYLNIDQIMIGSLLTLSDVGIYSVAVKLSMAWYFIPAIIVSSMMPYLTTMRKSNHELYSYRLLQLYSIMFWMGVSAGVVFSLFGDVIIDVCFGELYSGAYEALIYNIWSGIFISQAVVSSIWMINENMQKYSLYSNIIAVSLNSLLNYILIPILGVVGAAISTLITQALSTWVILFFWKPLRANTWNMIRSSNPLLLIQTVSSIIKKAKS